MASRVSQWFVAKRERQKHDGNTDHHHRHTHHRRVQNTHTSYDRKYALLCRTGYTKNFEKHDDSDLIKRLLQMTITQ